MVLNQQSLQTNPKALNIVLPNVDCRLGKETLCNYESRESLCSQIRKYVLSFSICEINRHVNRQNTDTKYCTLLCLWVFCAWNTKRKLIIRMLLRCHWYGMSPTKISNLYYIFMDPLCGVIHNKTSHFAVPNSLFHISLHLWCA